MTTPDPAHEIAPPGTRQAPPTTPAGELTRFILTALTYALGTWCIQASSAPPDFITPVWPPTPILLTGLLLAPTALWWAYFLIPFAADPIWWSITPYPWYQGLFASLANNSEAFAMAATLRWSGLGIPRFGQLRQAGSYFLLAAAAIALASSLGALSLWHPGGNVSYWRIWRDWYLADILSHLTLAPLLLSWVADGPAWLRALPLRRRAEGLLLLAGLVPTVLAVYGSPVFSLPGLIYLPLPFLLWAALRFGVLGTYVALTLTTLLSIWHITQATPSAPSPARVILSVQSFLIATSLPMALLTAVLREREDAQHDLLRYSQGLASAKDEAQAANRAKDEFLGVLSHELRTPLTPVLLTASLLEARRDLPDDVRDDVRSVRNSVELEARLIDDLLDVTRIARGKLQLRKETVDVHTAIRHALHLCCRDQAQVTIRVDLLADYHHAHVDPARLQQVLWNLLNNALKFTPPGGRVTIRTRNEGQVIGGEGQAEDGSPSSLAPCPSPLAPSLLIEVADTGIGIDPALLPKLFNAFEQGHSATTRRFGGLGLGLAISRAIAELHGGTLTASSPGPGQGSTFTLQLPTVPAPAPALPRGGIPQPPPPAAAPAARASLRILLVEDNPQTLKILTRFLRSLGHHVRPVDSGQAALAADQEEPFDLVISDLGLPDGSGHRLMQELRRRHAHLPGIAVSGYGAEDDIRQSRDAGFARHLTKPVTIQQLESVIEQVTP